MNLLPGQVVGNYRVIRPLGEGGMAVVYEVEHLKLGVHYALKTFTLEEGHVETLKSKFLAEGKVSRLAKQLLKEHALPPKEVTDAFHIATASVAGMDVLLTWNCRHMANPHSLPLTKKIVRKAGFHCPDIMTPKTFLDNLDLEK